MEAEAGHAVQQLARLTRRRDNLESLVERLSVLDGLSAGAAALGLLLEVRGMHFWTFEQRADTRWHHNTLLLLL